MPASDYQLATKAALERYFSDVQLEWSVVKDATDRLAADINRYAPRVDIAIGPFNTTPGPDPRIRDALLPESVRALFDSRPANPNARCLLAIEVVYSGSSKHILGDILNAGALGLYGIVIGSELMMPKIRRISMYLEVLAQLEKLPSLFQNVVVLSASEFDALFV